MLIHWFVLIGALLVLILAIIILIRVTLVVVTVENQSMSPTLEDGDRVLVLRYRPTRWLRKGQVVLVWPWDIDPPNTNRPFGVESPFIKRVVGIPGETIVTSITDLDPYNRSRELAAHDDKGLRTWYIPSGHYFVRGDHPIGGFDSLSWGPIPIEKVVGIVLMKLPRTTITTTQSPIMSQAMLDPRCAAPSFTAETVHGEKATLATYTGRIVVFLFVSPHCAPCREIIPHLHTIYLKLVQSKIDLVLVSTADILDTRPFVDEVGIQLPVLVAPSDCNSFVQDYKVPGTPFYCMVDQNGLFRSSGFPSPYDIGWRTLVDR